LNLGKTRFAHHPFGHQAPAHRDFHRLAIQRRLAVMSVGGMQLSSQRGASTVIRKRKAARAHFSEFAPAFGD
jgi:hypothetical protein